MIRGDDPHHDGSPLHVSEAAPSLGDVVSLRVRVPHVARVSAVHVRTAPDGEHLFTAARVVSSDDVESWWQVEVTCHNPVTHYRFLLTSEGDAEGDEDDPASPPAYRWLNGTGVHLRDVPDAHDFRLVTYAAPPAWAQDAVVYQVFPDRFARDASVEPAGDPGGPRTDLPAWAQPARWDDTVVWRGPGVGSQVFGGTLDGVREHLDHLVDLGVTVLYLTPVFPGRSNHRYDASTFDEVDPVLGGTEALLRLQAACHERGLRVLGDITTNHTGAGHEWYAAARRDPDGPAGARYVRDRASREGFVGWLGHLSLPKLDHRDPGLRTELVEGPGSVIQRWLGEGRGFDGWRVDVANMTGRHGDVDLTHQVARDTRAAVDEATGGEGLLIAEHTHDHSGDVRGDGWHGTMNYSAFTRPLWTWLRAPGYVPRFLGGPSRVPRLDAGLVVDTIRDFAALVPWRSLVHSMTLAGSHDTSRIRTLVAGDREQVVVAAAMLLTMPGIPMITYGDEVGLEGDTGEDGRRPMPWDDRGREGGRWDDATYAAYRCLVHLRTSSVALRRGGLRWLHADDDAIAFVREHEDESVLVHLARHPHAPVELPLRSVPGAADGAPLEGPTPGCRVVVDPADGVHAGGSLRLEADAAGVALWRFPTRAPAWAAVPHDYRGTW